MQLSTSPCGFLLDGHPFQMISGAMHYFRTHPEQWRDRLGKMRACGLNTVETYVAWNLHEPAPGAFCFEGFADIERFVRTAGEEGLHVIVRPGPYICSEWDGGGLPGWLHTIPGLRVRCYNRPYLERVDLLFTELLARLRPLQSTRGGPILAMQVENEYGSYGNDKRYLGHLRDLIRNCGIDVLLFTSDGPGDFMLNGGTLPDVLKTANFGSKPDEAFAKLREHQPEGPLACMEYWNGWFDHWGEKHHVRPAEEVAADLDRMLAAGASVNFYMFHGGTNFGFMSGANYSNGIQPTITSYDFDAPLNEAGDITPKFEAYRAVIAKTAAVNRSLPLVNSLKRAYGTVPMTESVALLDALDAGIAVASAPTLSMEDIGQNFGYVLYRHVVQSDWPDAKLLVEGLHDRAVVLLNGEPRGILTRKEASQEGLALSFRRGDRLDLLVESFGRINYGPQMFDRKGIVGHVRFGQQLQFGWEIHPLPFTTLDGIPFGPGSASNAPALYRGSFEVDDCADTFLKLEGWTKGAAFVNGFHLGCYWDIGPQRTLYVPAPVLRTGRNELVLFELHGTTRMEAEFVASPSWAINSRVEGTPVSSPDPAPSP